MPETFLSKLDIAFESSTLFQNKTESITQFSQNHHGGIS